MLANITPNPVAAPMRLPTLAEMIEMARREFAAPGCTTIANWRWDFRSREALNRALDARVVEIRGAKTDKARGKLMTKLANDLVHFLADAPAGPNAMSHLLPPAQAAQHHASRAADFMPPTRPAPAFDAAGLIREVETRCRVRIGAADGKLTIHPRGRLDAAAREQLTKHRAKVIAYLSESDML